MQVMYNAWQQAYKQPFGAIKVGQKVTWQIEITDAILNEVSIMLTKADQLTVKYLMKKVDKTHYQFVTPLNDAGIYFYHFRIMTPDGPHYFVHTLGGDGKLVSSPDEIQNFQLTCYTTDSPKVNWLQGAVMYQIFPDSFCNGNPHHEVTGRKPNSFLYATGEDLPYDVRNHDGSIARWSFYGGNLAGIKKQIPYLKKLRVTVLYLNPIFTATSNHRYDTNDFLQIDPMLGDESSFKELINELHANGIHLILDGVFNHVGEDSRYFNAHQLYGKDTGATQNKNSPYYDWFYFTKYPTDYKSWWGVKNLPEVNKNNPFYQQFIYGDQGVVHKWNLLGVDGWRLDVADELPMAFLCHLRERQEKDNRHVLIGEVWEDASNKRVNNELRTYIQGDNLTGTMNYPARNFIIDILQARNSAAMEKIIKTFLQIVENYPASFLQNSVNNIGTHDTARIKELLNGNEDLVALAFGCLFMLPGIPCIYYGDEAGLLGGKDPDNRRFFPWGRESEFLQKTVASWAQLRHQNDVLTDGQVGIALGTNRRFAIIRYSDQQAIIYIVNLEQKWEVGTEPIVYFNVPKGIHIKIANQIDGTAIPTMTGKKFIINLTD